MVESSSRREALRFWALFFGYVTVMLILAASPILLTIWIEPWISALIVAVFLWAWCKVIPTRPYMVQVCLAVWGAALMLGSLLACVALALHRLLA